ncbi:MAG: cold shock domain-containing protein [Bacteroidia bacterium]|nr:cold shock domain-containing protein [Bacteroidia bacterium]
MYEQSTRIINKKEREKKKQHKRREKERRKEERKTNAKEKSLDDMIAYVDEYGNITSTPPDKSMRKEISADQIEIGVAPSTSSKPNERTGKVSFFDHKKGYGFIVDDSGEKFFVHVSELDGPVNENDKVMFKTQRGPKGMVAVGVQLV